MQPELQQLLAAAREEVGEVTPAEAKAQIDSEGGLLLDVREAVEVQRGRIPGALHIPMGDVEAAADPDAPEAQPLLTKDLDQPIVVFCAGGVRSLLVAQTLKRMGYSNPVSMEGGIVRWQSEGLPTET